MADDTIKQIERFNDRIDQAKTGKTRITTQLEAVDTKLVDDFDAKTLTAAKKTLTAEQATDTRLGKEISEGKASLEERYDWPR